MKTLKHGLTILSTTIDHVQDWDRQLLRILFGYHCDVQASTKISPHMLLIGRTLRLIVDNSLSLLVQAFKDDENPIIIVE